MRKIIALAVLAVTVALYAAAGTTCRVVFDWQSAFVPEAVPESSTVFLCHFDTTSSTDVATGGEAPHGVSFVGDTLLSGDHELWGDASAKLDGSADAIDLGSSADWPSGTGDWTVEGWFLFDELDATVYLWNSYQDADNRGGMYRQKEGVGDYRLAFYWVVGGVVKAQYKFDTGFAFSTDTIWYHIACVREGSSLKIFVDGVEVTLDVVTPIGANSLGSFGGSMQLGAQNSALSVDGEIDEVRVSNIAVYSTNFTRPSAPFTP